MFSRMEATLSTPCAGCQHTEFVHSQNGPCLFSGCECWAFGTDRLIASE